MRIPLTLPLLLGLPLSSHALLDDWLPDPASYDGRDSVVKIVTSAYDSYAERYSVSARDAQGRPLASELERLREGQDSQASAFEFSWSFELGWSPLDGVAGCPARTVETRVIGTTCMRIYTQDYTWSPERRSLVGTLTMHTPLCRWTDSVTFDEHGRVTERRVCEEVFRSSSASDGIDTLGRVTIRRLGYEGPSDRHPRWIAQRADDTATFPYWDSVLVLGPVDRPTGAALFDGTGSSTYMIGHDSIARDERGRILSRVRRYHTAYDPTEHPLERREYEWQGDLLMKERRTEWGVRDSVINEFLALYSYGGALVGATRRSAPRGAFARRSAEGGIRLELSDARPATIRWVGLDGRATLLYRGSSRTSLELAAPRSPGFLRIEQAGKVATLRVPPL